MAEPTQATMPFPGGQLGSAPQISDKALYAKNYGVIADGLAVNDASWVNNANPVVVTSATANFIASRDNGKVCWGNDPSSGLNTAPVGILTVVNSTTANCSGTATATSSGAPFRWGTDDTAAWLAVNAAATASQTPTCIIGPNGLSVITKAPLIDTRAAGLWAWCFSGPVGGLTTFLPTPTFDPTTCTGNVLGACIWEPHQSTISQSVVPQYAKLDNVAVDGANFRCTAGYAGKTAFGLTKTEGHNIWAWNWCGTAAGPSTFSGISLSSPNSVYNLNANNTGGIGINFAATGGPTQTLLATSYAGAMLGGTDISVGSGNVVISKGNFWQACANQCINIVAGATMVMDGDTATQTTGTQYADVSGTLIVQGGTQIVPTSTTRAILTRAGGKVFIRDSVISIGGGGVALNINTVPGGSIINNGNNTITGTDQTLLVAANVVPSAGWGTTASVGSLSGTPLSNPTRFQFTVTSAGTGQAANPTIAITYPGTGGTFAQPYWTCKQTGGTGTNTSITGEGTATTTAMTLTFNGTPVASSTYQITCQGALL